ncbi:Protein WHAT'S THIS FACTOR 1 [Vitis vinifera]|uniref:Protein WHAT'S THIS FACTOR 1 n=1 Tax=Vitis vinifera TaxID=29760 RepID=A0A438KIE4_VITVI|nr:Protein WHAT'S THIS FACTOR 1 [Vitis vinifera]
MREWIRDWMELDYISPYADVSHLDQASPEMEKRTVGVFHELLSLSLFKRVPVPILGKFREEYREAYKDDELIDQDPLVEIKDRFLDLLAEGHRESAEQSRLQKEAVQKDMEMMSMRIGESDGHEFGEQL